MGGNQLAVKMMSYAERWKWVKHSFCSQYSHGNILHTQHTHYVLIFLQKLSVTWNSLRTRFYIKTLLTQQQNTQQRKLWYKSTYNVLNITTHYLIRTLLWVLSCLKNILGNVFFSSSLLIPSAKNKTKHANQMFSEKYNKHLQRHMKESQPDSRSWAQAKSPTAYLFILVNTQWESTDTSIYKLANHWPLPP